MNKSTYSAELITSSNKNVELSSMQIQIYNENNSPLSNQPLSHVFYGVSLKPNETTVVSLNMQAVPYNQVNWDELKQQQNNSKELKPITPTTYSSYKVNIGYNEMVLR